MWNRTLDQHLQSLHFKPTNADPCIYIQKQGGNLLIVSVYVDDCLIIGTRDAVNQTKQSLAAKFKIKDLGPVSSILGVEIIRDQQRGTLKLRQSGHIEALLTQFNMANCKPVSTPMVPGLALSKIEATPTDCLSIPYRKAVGKLLYIAIASRPDIAFSVGYLSQFVTAYNHSHWNAVKHLLRYLQGSRHQTITYTKSDIPYNKGCKAIPVGYCDADWGGSIINRKSTSGYVFTLAGGPIMWSSKAQSTVALSSTEAELNALSETVKQALYIRKFFEPLDINSSQPVPLWNDNQSSLCIATQPQYVFLARMKHYDIKLHHLRDTIAKGLITLQYCPTEIMPADLLTKALPRAKVEELKALLHLYSSQTSSIEGAC